MNDRTGDLDQITDWQDAVNTADFCLALNSAQSYGLVAAGQDVNVSRCEEVLAAGAARGFRPAADAVERALSVSAVRPRRLVVGKDPDTIDNL